MRVKEITTPVMNVAVQTAAWGETFDIPKEGDIVMYGFVAYYTLTDGGVENGENFEGILNYSQFFVNGSPWDRMERNELSPICDLFTEGIYSDLTPATTVEQFVFYAFPIPKSRAGVNSWQWEIQMRALTDEFAGATALAARLKPFVVYGPIEESIKMIRVGAAASQSPNIRLPENEGPIVGFLVQNVSDFDITQALISDKSGIVDVKCHGLIGSYLYAIEKRIDPAQASAVATTTAQRVSDPAHFYSGRLLVYPPTGGILDLTKTTSEATITFFFCRNSKVDYTEADEENESRGIAVQTSTVKE